MLVNNTPWIPLSFSKGQVQKRRRQVQSTRRRFACDTAGCSLPYHPPSFSPCPPPPPSVLFCLLDTVERLLHCGAFARCNWHYFTHTF